MVDGHTKQQAMKDKISALESEKVKRELEEMKVEPQVQASQVQPEPTPIDAAEANRRRLQEIEDQANLLLRMGKSCKKGGIHEYIEEFRDLQVSIMDMSGAEALDVFKRGLKDRIRKEVMVSNPSTVNEAIAIAQRISGAFGVTHGEPVSNFRDPSGPTPMELGNLRHREGFAPTRRPSLRFAGEIRRPRVLNLQEGYPHNGMVRGGVGVRDNRQCYACGLQPPG
ncbi:hypothetical protein AXG93_632s1220 [Marchantia polymorpha subsp. ruderalis]|uniref:Retrotransposon gag domain-containing protein n=1 Tax=Marchantia polymorpha subsp. ruderalis TaxID=1480154 RepID=A0A176WK07_MARPO|nr:hypothetical protein AXG93_632s1220 [Marchantia polymorpha subsp. ruderalis]